ncbi:MAG: repeat protein [Moraxellaceae bacterium]|jgi:RHS repeat-associated protein|nr:repeat protein [Moraxellaceae bacterium]
MKGLVPRMAMRALSCVCAFLFSFSAARAEALYAPVGPNTWGAPYYVPAAIVGVSQGDTVEAAVALWWAKYQALYFWAFPGCSFQQPMFNPVNPSGDVVVIGYVILQGTCGGGNPIYSTVIAGQCPEGYLRDVGRPATDPRACYFVPPVDPEQMQGDPESPDSASPSPEGALPESPEGEPGAPDVPSPDSTDSAEGGGAGSSGPVNCEAGAVGDPINTANGNKYATITDLKPAGASPLRLVRHYDSQMPQGGAFGSHWRHHYERQIETVSATSVKLRRPDGKALQFVLENGQWKAKGNINLRLQSLGTGQGWQVTTAQDERESYDAGGRLVSIAARSGMSQSLTYDSTGKLYTVTDSHGHQLRFEYDAQGRIATVFDPAGQPYRYTYDAAGNLNTRLTPDNRTIAYRYEYAAFPHALTSVEDGNGLQTDYTLYDAKGRAYSNGASAGTDQLTINYGDDYTATVTDSRNVTYGYTFELVQGVLKATGLTRSCPTCGTVARSFTRDANGNITSRTDFNGIRTTYAYDLARNLEISRTEAVGTPQQRIIATEWHPTFNLPVTITEPGRTTVMVYSDSGNMESLAVTDTATGEVRTWRYTYGDYGLLASRTLPGGENVHYVYDGRGFLTKATTSAGLATEYLDYDANGRVGRIVYPNGLTMAFTYDGVGRVLTRSETVANPDGSNGPSWWQVVADWLRKLFGGEPLWPEAQGESGIAVTRYSYDNAGLLTDIELPDGETLHYEYDAAYRVVRAKDALGNTIDILRDPYGKPLETQITDPSGVLARTLVRSYDGLGRLAKVSGNNGQQLTQRYDDEGYLLEQTNALGQRTQRGRDALYRTTSLTDADNRTTGFDFDPLDQLTGVTDARGNRTAYGRNAFGEAVTEHSPDRGNILREFENGRLKRSTDARGITHAFGYDADGRVTSRTSPEGTVTYRYDEGEYGQGRLTTVLDASGRTHYRYNSQGRVVEKASALNDGPTLTVGYGYTLGGKLKEIATPGKHLIRYGYDAQGRLASVTVDGTLLLDQMRFGAAGITGWTWGNGELRREVYDLDGRVTQIDSGSALARRYGYDTANRLTSLVDTQAGVNDRYGYDALGRLIFQQSTAITYGYQYDALGNRTQKQQSGQGGSITTSYTIDADNNRLLGETTAGKSQAYGYLPSGQLSHDGTATYRYNDEGRLVEVTGQRPLRNRYNALGQRVRKAGRGVTVFAFDEAGRLLGEYTPGGVMVREYVWLGSRLVGMLSQQEKGVLSVHADHLGTPRAVSAGTTVLWRWEGEAFGNSQPNEQVAGPSRKFTLPLRFPGQYHDSETGLFYNYFRDYSPASGRYVESDPVGMAGGVNPYIYTTSDPLHYIDPFGLDGVLPYPAVPAFTDALSGFARGLFAGLGTAGAVVTGAFWPSSLADGTLNAERPPGYWPGDAGAAEWGRRNGVGAREGKGRFHGIKQSCPGSRATDDWSTNPETGDVIDPNGDSWGNLEDVKSK